jgi:hypothetical protein
MLTKKTKLILPEGEFSTMLTFYDESDKQMLRNIYKQWVDLSNALENFGGRRVNIPELLSEAIYCIHFNAGRMSEGIPKVQTSFDCYNPNGNKRIQVKACSVEDDLTSFGPKSVWDEIYFIHFYPNKKYDGSYAIYYLDNNLIYNHKVNKNQTMREQQLAKRRPRMSLLKEIIVPQNIKPIIVSSL